MNVLSEYTRAFIGDVRGMCAYATDGDNNAMRTIPRTADTHEEQRLIGRFLAPGSTFPLGFHFFFFTHSCTRHASVGRVRSGWRVLRSGYYSRFDATAWWECIRRHRVSFSDRHLSREQTSAPFDRFPSFTASKWRGIFMRFFLDWILLSAPCRKTEIIGFYLKSYT